MEKGLERCGKGLRRNAEYIRAVGIPAEVGTRYPVALQVDWSHGLHCGDVYSYKEWNSLDERSDHHKASSYEWHLEKNGQMSALLSGFDPHVFV